MAIEETVENFIVVCNSLVMKAQKLAKERFWKTSERNNKNESDKSEIKSEMKRQSLSCQNAKSRQRKSMISNYLSEVGRRKKKGGRKKKIKEIWEGLKKN